MTFEIVKREAADFGGLVLPRRELGSTVHAADLMKFTRERIHQRGIDDLTTVYVAVPDLGWSAVVGYRCAGLDDLAIGDVLVRVPAGYFAKFLPDGRSSDPIEDVWLQAEIAEKEGRIERAFTEEVESLRSPSSVELFISLA
ncbi:MULTISPECIES: hypothetical protein [Rhodococcus]|jgi:hypothetical protein|uniref:AraC family transcriptional regulator n=1 Tax=Rhodococcus oxybenzonivorans TaxID=1990687 RepID=A0AAE5A555_9NOCA|nr:MULTISPECIES: hypothetical protein [Rhodococcus]MDV7246504.1 hypothetical protein [Rhodococcus oxybenzonivorans]MDV7264500.1 hypothetical protein [Rhodococcus oxybenzonivorans]MDV7278126.1 hypothetical protein [Rhodococcus oxybenzonivorans]MDV7337561.1 hypothetical protein [Rhodococcus oxybenzonivorans]MDV7347714.1 hypothetical protein [Rhodococcus oxybenzonivorans]